MDYRHMIVGDCFTIFPTTGKIKKEIGEGSKINLMVISYYHLVL